MDFTYIHIQSYTYICIYVERIYIIIYIYLYTHMQIRIVYKLQTSPDSAWRSGWTATTEAVAPTKRSSVGLPEFFLGRPSHGRTCWGCGAADGSSIFLNSHECPIIWNNHELLLIGVYCISEQSNGRQLQEAQVCNCDWFGIRVVLPFSLSVVGHLFSGMNPNSGFCFYLYFQT